MAEVCVMIFMNMNCKISLCEFDSIFLEKSWDWLNDPYINYYSATGLITKGGQLEWFNSLKTRSNYMIWGVKYQDEPIGACRLKNIKDGQAEYWGYIGEKQLHGQGIGYDMLTSVLIKAEGIYLSKIVLKVLFENQRAIHLYKKCLFNEFDRDDKYI